MESKEVIQGAKILTLYKGHYLDAYQGMEQEPFKSEYISWGYYDGISITSVKTGNSKLFQKKSKSAISDIWYQIAESMYELNGKFSEQNIGIFRPADGEETFWEIKNRKIFITVCFIQVKPQEDVEKIARRLELESNDMLNIIAYSTFDNADLVVFLQSNSYKSILTKIEEWEAEEKIPYIHSISGVQRQVLEKANNNGGYVCDCAGNPLINDSVDELQMNILAMGKDFAVFFKGLFDEWNKKFSLKNYDKIQFFYRDGHQNYTFRWRDTDMQSVVYLLMPGGIGTYSNNLFGRKMYNIETKIYLEANEFEVLDSKFLEDKDGLEELNSWCDEQIKLYREYAKKALMRSDEGFYANCKSMIQTINMLSQYANFKMSDEIFYIIYPAFRMFTEQFQKVYDINPEKVKDTMREFAEDVNSIVYHAIHTNQMFLMIPGYSGTSYSIPTKLSLFYLWYLEQVSDILNDASHKYQFFLTPVTETRPRTSTVEFGLPPEDRLISVKISQRSLYMPRTLLIILAHETAHYVGDSFRERKYRVECVIRTLGHLLAEGIMPDEEIISEDARVRKKKLIKYLTLEIADYINSNFRKENTEDRYHTSRVTVLLERACAVALADENKKIFKILSEEIDETGSFSERIERIDIINNNAVRYDKRRKQIYGSDECMQMVKNLLNVYKEVFSDLVAQILLGFDEEEYNTAMDISDGMKISIGSGERFVRQRIFRRNINGNSIKDENVGKEKEKSVVQYWPYTDVVEHYLKQYADKCEIELKKYLECDQDRLSKVEEIKKILDMFSNTHMMWDDIYKTVIAKAYAYSRQVEDDIKKVCSRKDK